MVTSQATVLMGCGSIPLAKSTCRMIDTPFNKSGASQLQEWVGLQSITKDNYSFKQQGALAGLTPDWAREARGHVENDRDNPLSCHCLLPYLHGKVREPSNIKKDNSWL